MQASPHKKYINVKKEFQYANSLHFNFVNFENLKPECKWSGDSRVCHVIQRLHSNPSKVMYKSTCRTYYECVFFLDCTKYNIITF